MYLSSSSGRENFSHIDTNLVLSSDLWEETANSGTLDLKYLHAVQFVGADGEIAPCINTKHEICEDHGKNFWYLYVLYKEIREPLPTEECPINVFRRAETERSQSQNVSAWDMVCDREEWSSDDKLHQKVCAWFCLGKPKFLEPVTVDYFGRVRVWNRGTAVVTLFSAAKVDGRKTTVFFLAREEFHGVNLTVEEAFETSGVLGSLARFKHRLTIDSGLKHELKLRVDCLVHQQLHTLLDRYGCMEVELSVEHRDKTLDHVISREKYVSTGFNEVTLKNGAKKFIRDCRYCEHAEHVELNM